MTRQQLSVCTESVRRTSSETNLSTPLIFGTSRCARYPGRKVEMSPILHIDFQHATYDDALKAARQSVPTLIHQPGAGMPEDAQPSACGVKDGWTGSEKRPPRDRRGVGGVCISPRHDDLSVI